jgi:hypothetical protein
LFEGITHLTFGVGFDQYLSNYLPSTLTHLTLGTNFNKSIKGLPLNITHLVFGTIFNEPIYDNSHNQRLIPDYVRYLTLVALSIKLSEIVIFLMFANYIFQ